MYVKPMVLLMLQIKKFWMKAYQQLGEEPRLLAEQHCPQGVENFPYRQLNVWCRYGNDCGQVMSPPNITGQSLTTHHYAVYICLFICTQIYVYV